MTANVLIINTLAVIWSFKIFLKSWLTNVKDILLTENPCLIYNHISCPRPLAA